MKIEECSEKIVETLYDIQANLLTKNKTMRNDNTVFVDTYEAFQKALDDEKFVMAHRDGTAETEESIKQECKAVTRCIPIPSEQYDYADKIFEQGICIKTGKPSMQRVLFARSY